MNLKRKQKQILSLVVASAMVLSGMSMEAAAEPIEQDTKPAITTEAGAGLTPDVTGEEKEETDKETEEAAKKESEAESSEETLQETEEETEEESGEETKEETQEETGEGTGEETREQNEEGTDGETEEETGEDTDGETKEGTEESTKEDGLPEDSAAESSEDPETSGVQLPEESTSGVHEHSWSADWSFDDMYHWHECDDEDCPGEEHSQKDGYAEHTYDDYGVCTGCGYDVMDGIALAAEGLVPSYQDAYDSMIGLKETYPEGMTWTNYEPYGTKGNLGSAYTWKGGPIYGARSGVGCMAFAFILSDEAFGNLPARPIAKGKFTFEDVKVGDILRVKGNSHSVIVLKKSTGGVVVAEGNYNKSVHWGRTMSASEVKNADFIITRYPQGHKEEDSGADEIVHGGTVGSSLSWSMTSGGVLTISGNGAIPNYSQSNPSPWKVYENEYDMIVMKDGVTGIGNYAFSNSKAISVYIPDTVKTIGQNAFNGSSLVEVTIPGSVEVIGSNAFRDCASLCSATVSEGMKTIGEYAFRGCTSLEYIDFPKSITSVGTGAFMSCGQMVSVRFNSGTSKVELGDSLFAQCYNLTTVTLPQTADCIGSDMFASCILLRSLYIPVSVKEFGEHSFSNCNLLEFLYYGGSEEEWNEIIKPPSFEQTLPKITKIVYDAEFDDPFATDPDDPGDFHPDEDNSCTNHVDADQDGKCDNCGKTMSSDNPGSDNESDGDNNPGSSGGTRPPSTDRPSGGGSDSSSGSSGGSSSGSSSGSSDNYNRYGSSTVSTTVSQKADGSSVTTKIQGDGSVITITDRASGASEVEARLSSLAIDTARRNGEAVALPVPAVPVVRDASAAQMITVYTQRDELVKVAIPTVAATPGTVAVMVNGDGSTSVIKGSVVTEKSVVAALPNGATVKIVDNSKSFPDVPAGVWYEDAVSFISARDLFYHTTETAFTPGAPMTYGVLTTALARFDGAQTDGGAAWYEKSMEWAVGRSIGEWINPDSNITCDQLAVMLWKYQGSPSAADGPSDNLGQGQISDMEKAMKWMTKNDIVSGFEEGAWAPQKPVNRSQAAQIIMNFAKKAAVSFPR